MPAFITCFLSDIVIFIGKSSQNEILTATRNIPVQHPAISHSSSYRSAVKSTRLNHSTTATWSTQQNAYMAIHTERLTALT